MTGQLLFGTSVAFSFVAWAVVAALYIWPQLRGRSRVDALQPLLVLHAFRFIGLSFLVPGVVSPDLPIAFARGAAYGDIVAAILALATLTTLRTSAGIALAWAFNVWGSFDLVALRRELREPDPSHNGGGDGESFVRRPRINGHKQRLRSFRLLPTPRLTPWRGR
jgi:uncharacterized membrane protein